MSVATAAMLAQNPQVVQGGMKGLKWVGILLILSIGGYFGYKAIKEARKRSAENEAGKSDSTPESVAQTLYSELNAWFTDEEKIIRIANQISDLTAVKKAYQKLYNKSLDEDLAKALNTDELERFKRNATESKTGNDPQTGNRYAPKDSRTPKYNAKIAYELKQALKYDCTLCTIDRDKLLVISTRIYDFDGREGVAYQFAWQTRNIDPKKPKGLNLRDEINNAFYSWQSTERDEFWRNVERNRNLKEQP
jgi:hypothetical protein